MTTPPTTDIAALMPQALDLLRRAGADQADIIIIESLSVEAGCRLGKLEQIEHSQAVNIGLRGFVGKQQSLAGTTWPTHDSLAELVDRVMDMARVAPEDPYCGLASADRLATASTADHLELVDHTSPPASETLADAALEAESVALDSPGITLSEGARASFSQQNIAYANSHGFCQNYAVTSHGLQCVVIASAGDTMERDYDYHTTRHRSDLDTPEQIGRQAAARTAARLGATKPASCRMPVVFHPRVGARILHHLAAAISGDAIARATSFLTDCRHQQIFAPEITIIDDPSLPRGLRSTPFDAEGVHGNPLHLIDQGVLTAWLLDSRAARQLDLTSTGHAARSTATTPHPSPTNLSLSPGTISPDDLIAETGSGLYITELIGTSANIVTGDYSSGAVGFRIVNGQRAGPVHEFTIAANLRDMFASISPANDLQRRHGIDTPTLRVASMTIAGT